MVAWKKEQAQKSIKQALIILRDLGDSRDEDWSTLQFRPGLQLI